MFYVAPDKNLQSGLFVANIVTYSFKDDLASMEHPLFSLRAGDRVVRHYQHNETTVTVFPGPKGSATIHDKDIWIYCMSQLVEAQNRGLAIDRGVRFTAYDFLVATNRGTDGRGYVQMADALARLKGTTIETNIETFGRKERAGFGLIDSWRIIEKSNGRMVAVEVILPDWLLRSIKNKKILTLPNEYFCIRKPLYRRVYEIARKHCGHQIRWPISMKALHEKSGSKDELRNFRRKIKELAKSGELPGYLLAYNLKKDTVNFYSRGKKGFFAWVNDIV